jgi:hypothetical protein
MFLLPVAMRKHLILLHQRAPLITGQRENLHLFSLFYRDEIKCQGSMRVAIPIGASS